MMRRAVLVLVFGAVGSLACSGKGGRPGDPMQGQGTRGTQGTQSSLGPGLLAPGELDRLVATAWQRAGVTPSPTSDDATYLRRVTLDLAGRIPTLPEARAFLADQRADKRAALVDRLLASADHAEHFADLYAGLLYGHEATGKKLEKQADPRGYLVTAFAENRRYDRLAYELVTATGALRDNGAVAFIVARAKGGGGVEAVAGATARIFLGLQIQCAQCHDHPYDARWKQEDFYGLVAYFARTKARNEKDMMGGRSVEVVEQKKGQAKMRRPRSEAEEVVDPRFLGMNVRERPGETRRQALGRAIVASDLFPKAMVARTWAHLFGQGLVDPWDDLGAERDEKHPPALNRLAEDFRASGFDVRRLVRHIALSSAYQRDSARPPGIPEDDGAAARVFARARVRPLSPEQLYRMLTVATGSEARARAQLTETGASRIMNASLKELRFAFDDDEMAEANAFDGTVPQALLLLNGELTNEAVTIKGSRGRVTKAALTSAAGGSLGQLAAILATTRDPVARLDALFLSVYARLPTADERAPFLAHVHGVSGVSGEAGARERAVWEDVLFALVTSTEAVTNH